MDVVRNAVLCAVGVSLALAVAEMLQPSTKFYKQIRLLFSLVLLIGVVSPFAKDGISLSLPTGAVMQETETAVEACVTDAVQTQAQSNLALSLRAALTRAGLSCREIVPAIHIGADGSISITEVRLSSAEFEAAAACLRGLLGEEVPIRPEEATP